MFEFLSSAATGPALSLQILSENVSDPPTLIPLLLLILILFRLLKISLHTNVGPLKKKKKKKKKERKKSLSHGTNDALLSRGFEQQTA